MTPTLALTLAPPLILTQRYSWPTPEPYPMTRTLTQIRILTLTRTSLKAAGMMLRLLAPEDLTPHSNHPSPALNPGPNLSLTLPPSQLPTSALGARKPTVWMIPNPDPRP